LPIGGGLAAVQSVQTPPVEPSPSPTLMPKEQKPPAPEKSKLIPLLVGVAVLIVVAVGAWTLSSQTAQKKKAAELAMMSEDASSRGQTTGTPAVAATPVPTPTPAPVPDSVVSQIQKVQGVIVGKLCLDSKVTAPGLIWVYDVDKKSFGNPTPIEQNQDHYAVTHNGGRAYVFFMSMPGANGKSTSTGYTNPDHTLKELKLTPGVLADNIDLCDGQVNMTAVNGKK
jgi:type II secretory pathway pseudopilin PulG